MTRPLALALLLAATSLAGAQQDARNPGKKPDAKKPDAKKPDAKKPDAKKPDAKKDPKKPDAKKDPKKPKERKLDKTSDVAKALRDLLVVDTKYGTDKRVEIVYEFDKKEQGQDFLFKKWELVRWPGELRLNGSGASSLLLHKLHMQGNFEIELTAQIRATQTKSIVVFVFGSGKSGAVFGNAFAKGSKRGYRPMSPPNKRPWFGGREVVLRYKIEDGVKITGWVNKKKIGTTKKLKNRLDGQLGVFVTLKTEIELRKLVIRGEIEPAKLDLKR